MFSGLKRFKNSCTKPLLEKVIKNQYTEQDDFVQTHHSLFLALYSEYFTTPDHIPEHDFMYTFSIYDNIIKHAEDDESRSSYVEKRTQLDKYNGLMLSPCNNDPAFHLFINKNRITPDADFGKTLCHELTHMFDFYLYMQRYNLVSLRNEPDIPDYYLYWFLSEFRARCRSFIVYINYKKYTANIAYSKIESSFREYERTIVSQIIEELQANEWRNARYNLAQYWGQLHAVNVCFNKSLNYDPRLNGNYLDFLYSTAIRSLYLENYFDITTEAVREVRKNYPSMMLI